MDTPSPALGPFVGVSIFWALSTLLSSTSLCDTQLCPFPIPIHCHKKPASLPSPPAAPLSSLQSLSRVSGDHTMALEYDDIPKLTKPL